jgi:hypothetical protein
MGTMKTPIRCLSLPLRDFYSAIEVCLAGGGTVRVLAILLSSVISWWIYVPVHELLHAIGCVMAGGSVQKLEISGIYGAAVLKKVFPFVSVGSNYSGRLAGFSTGGSDVTFFITDFLPYLLTILVGIPLLKSIPSQKTSALIKSICLGVAAPIAYAPFMSVFGDYYEMGSILVSRLASAGASGMPLERWRSDDLFRLIHRLWTSGTAHGLDAVVVISSLLVGVILIYVTYWTGTLFTRTIIR